MTKLTFFTRAALLILATSWSLGLAAPVPAPTDFWVRDQPGRITHACGGKEPMVLCMQGRKVVMQVQCDRTKPMNLLTKPPVRSADLLIILTLIRVIAVLAKTQLITTPTFDVQRSTK